MPDPTTPPTPVEFVHGQGATLTWGIENFYVKSIQFSNSLGSEIDITSMESLLTSDPYDSNRKLVVQDADSCFSGKGGGEVSAEILIPNTSSATNPLDVIGSKRPLQIKLGVGGISIQSTAILTQYQLGISVGEYVTASATFKLSGA